MDVAPERFLAAGLEVMYYAMLEARVLAWGGSRFISRLSGKRDEQIADLLSAVHNLPHLLQAWGKCDQQMLREYLAAYDQKWHGKGRSLLAIYDRALAQPE